MPTDHTTPCPPQLTAPPLLLVGASTRAAAWSANRAGFHPFCADLFGDQDLRQIATVLTVDTYPEGLFSATQRAPECPWLYTGALENHVEIVDQLAAARTLWGNGPAVLSRIRDPWYIADLLGQQGLPCPALRESTNPPDGNHRWVLRRLNSSAGNGIVDWTSPMRPPPCPTHAHVLQEYIEGDSAAALCLADHDNTRVIGVTRQLVGESWLAAGTFSYCGSIGPLSLADTNRQILEELARTLAHGCGLRGLFGIDLVINETGPWPIEINPRFPASAEVLERALNISVLQEHARVFSTTPLPTPHPSLSRPPSDPVVGKAILFSPHDIVTGPLPLASHHLADIPAVGTPIASGRPICTVLVSAGNSSPCRDRLQAAAADVYAALGITTVS